MERDRPSPGSVTRPEKLFAYADSYGTSFFLKQKEAIEKAGGSIVLRGYWFPIGLSGHARAPSVRSVSQWQFAYGVPLLRRDRKAIITVSNAPPYSLPHLVEWFVSAGSQLIYHRVALTSRRSPLWPLSPQFFSEAALSELANAQDDFYRMIAAIQKAHPNLVIRLPPTDGVWRSNNLQTLLAMPVRLVYPYFQALDLTQPNAEDFKAWKDRKLDIVLRKKLQTRLVSQWVVDRYRNFLTASALVAVPWAGYGIYRDVTSGDFQRQLEMTLNDIRELPERFSRENLNRAMRAYEQNPEGLKDVVQHYDEQIEVLRKRIAANGDETGEIEAEIRRLEESRELLKN